MTIDKLNIWILILVTFATASCIDEIPLETNGEVDLLVIAGSINNGPGPYQVRIGRSGDFSEDQLGISSPVTGANVIMRASNGTFSNMVESSPGIYETTDLNFKGEIGNAYSLEVVTADGETYQSTAEKMLPVPAITGIETTVVTEQVLNSNNSLQDVQMIKYFVSTSIPPDNEGVGLKWNFGSIYEFLERENPATPLVSPKVCYVKQLIDLNKVVVQEGNLGERVDVNRKEVFKQELDFRYSSKYCFHLYQQSLTPTAYEFWNKVEQLIGRTGSLFEAPPGKINGNITNSNSDEEILGYFYATAIDTMRLYTTPRDLDLVIRQACASDDPDLVDICFNCTLLTNSTLNKPIYWE